MKRRAMDSLQQEQEQEQQPRYKILVKTMKTVALDVKCTDTVDQIKSKISAIEGIDKNQQMLFFAGSHLADHNRLADYDIMKNSSVDLYVTDGMQISVNIPSVRKTIKLSVNKSHSVADIKAAIEEKAGIPDDELILMYAGQQLEDHQMLGQCGLSHDQMLHALVCPTDKLHISVNVEGLRTVNLDVKCWYTVADVKLLIETMVGLPAFTQIVMKAQSHGDAALTDTETLQSLHIENDEVLMVYQSIQLFIRTWEGKTLSISARTSDTTKNVMKKIEEKLPIKEGVYYLQYRGRVLSPGDTLYKSKVESNSTIDIRVRNFEEVILNKKKR